MLEQANSKKRYMQINIGGKEINTVTLERVLRLPFGTIEDSLGNDPGLDALMRLVQTYPWLLEVAEANFDEKEAKKILIRNGSETACQLLDGKK